MLILNVEDDAFKHNDICKVLNGCGRMEIEWVMDLETGLNALSKSMESDKKYDLIITDMYYPLTPSGREDEAGEIFIRKANEMGSKTPIILCSSLSYVIPGIYGTLHYSDRTDWEGELREMIRNLK